MKMSDCKTSVVHSTRIKWNTERVPSVQVISKGKLQSGISKINNRAKKIGFPLETFSILN